MIIHIRDSNYCINSWLFHWTAFKTSADKSNNVSTFLKPTYNAINHPIWINLQPKHDRFVYLEVGKLCLKKWLRPMYFLTNIKVIAYESYENYQANRGHFDTNFDIMKSEKNLWTHKLFLVESSAVAMRHYVCLWKKYKEGMISDDWKKR